jgi:hypothetical protein
MRLPSRKTLLQTSARYDDYRTDTAPRFLYAHFPRYAKGKECR